MTHAEISENRVSSYLEYLPATLQEPGSDEGGQAIGRFLIAFEALLSGLGDPDHPGLAERIDRIHTYLDPDVAPEEFLPWLASWVGLTLRSDWTTEQKRRLLRRVVPLYRKRGTKAGLEDMLRTYTDMGVEIRELVEPLQIGEVSTVGVDTVIGGGPPHYFHVRMLMRERDAAALGRQNKIARDIISMEKPAHTTYDLEIDVPAMQIGVHSTVGVDTLLGTKT